MSTAPPVDQSMQHGFQPVTGGAASNVDPTLVQQTKMQIRGLVNEITRLSQSNCSLEEFYDGFMNRVVSALASVGGAVWALGANDNLELRYQINLAKARLDDEDSQFQHSVLLHSVLSSGQSVIVQPRSGSADEDEAGNPTDYLLLLATIKIDNQVLGIVEIFQRPGGGPTTQRGYLRFLLQMCDLASDFLKNRRLRHFNDRQELWDKLEQFIHTIHGSLDVRDTVYTVANEGRRLIQADRVSVALCNGRKCKIDAVSGLDSIDRRAREIRMLGQLATTVVRGGQPLWYHGDTDDLPPQIESKLNKYVDRSHSRLVAVIPLRKPLRDGNGSGGRYGRTIAALIVEQLKDNRLTDAYQKRVEVVAQHSADALNNSLEHNSLFLLPLWKALGKSTAVLALRNLPTTLLLISSLVAIVAAFCVVPADFDLSATGALRPTVRRDVFAHVDGTLVEVPVQPGQNVEEGTILARLENNKLESEVIGLHGKLSETQKQINAINRTIVDNPHMRPAEEIQLSGRIAQLEEAKSSVQRQSEIYREQQRLLIVTSPVSGQVATWQVRDKLLQRPVQRGQRLMTVFDPSSDWELELQMPERRMGHVDHAANRFSDGLKVVFILATHPGKAFVGRVIEIDKTAETRDENGNTIRIRVAVNKEELPDLRDGAKVTARVHCGRESMGYVWFHELIETVQAKVLFWF